MRKPTNTSAQQPKNKIKNSVYLASEGQSGVICSLFLKRGLLGVLFRMRGLLQKSLKISLLSGLGDLLSAIR
jgi:hypothetical protein